MEEERGEKEREREREMNFLPFFLSTITE